MNRGIVPMPNTVDDAPSSSGMMMVRGLMFLNLNRCTLSIDRWHLIATAFQSILVDFDLICCSSLIQINCVFIFSYLQLVVHKYMTVICNLCIFVYHYENVTAVPGTRENVAAALPLFSPITDHAPIKK